MIEHHELTIVIAQLKKLGSLTTNGSFTIRELISLVIKCRPNGSEFDT